MPTDNILGDRDLQVLAGVGIGLTVGLLIVAILIRMVERRDEHVFLESMRWTPAPTVPGPLYLPAEHYRTELQD